MFTGIVQTIGEVTKVERQDHLLRYAVAFEAPDLAMGASVAIDGVCQTAVALDADGVWFEVTDETCRCTTLAQLSEGDRVHIERSARFGDEIGGHIVSGHVAACVKLLDREENVYTFSCDGAHFLFEKGFVALNGVSLTLTDVTESSFKVHLIPETLARTTFAEKDLGELINIEYDPMTVATVETVTRVLCRSS